jgi:hypothetical protein
MTRKEFLLSLGSLLLLRKLPKVVEEKEKLYDWPMPKNLDVPKIEGGFLSRTHFVFFPESKYHTQRIDGNFTANKRILK